MLRIGGIDIVECAKKHALEKLREDGQIGSDFELSQSSLKNTVLDSNGLLSYEFNAILINPFTKEKKSVYYSGEVNTRS